MKRSMFVAVLTIFIFLMGCSMLTIDDTVEGKWRSITDTDFWINFAKGGTLSNSAGDVGTWSASGDKLLLSWVGRGSFIVGYAFFDHKLTLTYITTETFSRY